MSNESAKWLLDEDKGCFSQRAERLKWLISKSPSAQILTFPGGFLGKQLFEEARYCFVYGQLLASAILGFAFVERTLAAMFYGAGRNDLQRATSEVLFLEGHTAGWLTEQELEAFDKARCLRNPLVHFRKPGHKDSPEFRGVSDDRHPYEVVEDDAKHILGVMFRLVQRNAAS